MSGEGPKTLPSAVASVMVGDLKEAVSSPAPDAASEAGPDAALEAASDAVPDAAAEQGADAVPDGGLQAWLQVLGAWVVLFCTWGLVNSFGVYQTFYARHFLSSRSASDISWIGSIQGAVLLTGGIISGPLYDRGYFAVLLWTGFFLIVFGQFMTSLSTTYWQVVLAQGVCIGIGCGLVFPPSTAILSQYFSRHFALVNGIASTGSPLAGISLSIVFSRLQPKIGFGWATRVVALILLCLSTIPLLCLKSRIGTSKRRRAVLDETALKDPAFTTCCLGGVFVFMAAYVPFFYIDLFSLDHHLTTSHVGYTVTILNAGSIFGRVGSNYLADKLGGPLMMALSSLTCLVMICAWYGISNLVGLIVFAFVYGLSSGGILSTGPAAVYAITDDLNRVGTRLGMLYFLAGWAVLIGTPVAGAVLGNAASGRRWHGLIGFTALALLIGTCLFMSTTVIAVRRLRRKADEACSSTTK